MKKALTVAWVLFIAHKGYAVEQLRLRIIKNKWQMFYKNINFRMHIKYKQFSAVAFRIPKNYQLQIS